jgi:hypothetical protein
MMVMAVATGVSVTIVRVIVRMAVLAMCVVVRQVMCVGSVCHRFAGTAGNIPFRLAIGAPAEADSSQWSADSAARPSCQLRAVG